MPTEPCLMAGGRSPKGTTHMLVANGMLACSATSRHALDAGRGVLQVFQDAVEFRATRMDGRDRPGAVRVEPQRMAGERSASARIAAISWSGANTPPLSLIEVNP